MNTIFKEIHFLSENKIVEVPVKGEFHQAACKHVYKKGKIIKTGKRVFKSNLPKDITLCIKCGRKKGR